MQSQNYSKSWDFMGCYWSYFSTGDFLQHKTHHFNFSIVVQMKPMRYTALICVNLFQSIITMSLLLLHIYRSESQQAYFPIPLKRLHNTWPSAKLNCDGEKNLNYPMVKIYLKTTSRKSSSPLRIIPAEDKVWTQINFSKVPWVKLSLGGIDRQRQTGRVGGSH